MKGRALKQRNEKFPPRQHRHCKTAFVYKKSQAMQKYVDRSEAGERLMPTQCIRATTLMITAKFNIKINIIISIFYSNEAKLL